MTPHRHDEFVALCALFPSGEPTEEEWALLQVHLAYCGSCRVLFEEYRHLADNVMPVLAAIACSDSESKPGTSSFSLDRAEQRLMSHLSACPADHESPHRRKTRWQIPARIPAACAWGVARLIDLHIVRSKEGLKTQLAASVVAQGTPQPASGTGAGADRRPALVPAQEQVATLHQQLSAAEERVRKPSSSAATMEHRLRTEQGERKKISDLRDSFSQQLAGEQTETQSLRARSAAGAMADQQAAQTSAFEAKVRELRAALDEKDRVLALDRDFLEHDRDFLEHDREIRALIAARNLYIADIFDVAQNGKTAKPFGRLFYTKDKSLVFYGYELDSQAGLKNPVHSQAWGSSDDKQSVSLGLLLSGRYPKALDVEVQRHRDSCPTGQGFRNR